MTNKIVIFIIMLIGFVQVSFAQTQQFENKAEAYNYWAKRGVIEIVYAYMEDYTEIKPNDKDEIEGKKGYHDFFLKDTNSFMPKEISTKFGEISNFLKKNSWTKCEGNIFQTLKTQLGKHTPLNPEFFAVEIEYTDKKSKAKKSRPIDFIADQLGGNLNEKHPKWAKKVKEIIDGYNGSLSQIQNEKPAEIVQHDSITTKQTSKEDTTSKERRTKKKGKGKTDATESTEDESFSWKIFFLCVCIFIIGIFVGGFLIFSISKNKIKSILNEEDYYSYLNNDEEHSQFIFGYLRAVYLLQKQKIDAQTKLDEQKQKIDAQNSEKKELSNENKRLEQKLTQKLTQKPHQRQADISPQPVKRTTEIYFSMPESDGSFQLSNGESSNDGKKYFKIEFEESSNKGDLSYLSGDRDQRAINRLESYLKPVCDIENITNSSTATKIELIRSGRVSRSNSGWIIDPNNKIKIKLY